MKAVVILFDTLNRKFLPNYGAEWVHAPNFHRLGSRTVTFDTCYGGSMPCMPARRELHTGRYNFLHRSWGPLEPFDDSAPELLAEHGIYTHLVTDHQHYWEDGGATYHNRFRSFEFFRGQEGDRWKGIVKDPDISESVSWRDNAAWRQDWVNRQYMQSLADHPQTRTVDAGLEFIEANCGEDDWMIQIECFDPHEPFLSYAEHKEHYHHEYNGPHFDWPDYRKVVEDDATVEHARREYAALLTMCDSSLGRILDSMDKHDLWDDTMLIVMTDHGLLLGEHGWWGKNVQPWYDENIHTPLFIWDPRTGIRNERRRALVQTIDMAPTLLGFFGAPTPPDMQGVDLAETIRSDAQVRSAGLFGSYGAQVNVTDGRYVYMRTAADPSNAPLREYTLMPTHMNTRFAPQELIHTRLASPFTFTKGVPLLDLPGQSVGNPYALGSLLFDLHEDPDQTQPLRDNKIELYMINHLLQAMRTNDAPESQFQRLGLPAEGDADEAHLQLEKAWPQVLSSQRLPTGQSSFQDEGPGVLWPVERLLLEDTVRDVLLRYLPFVNAPMFLKRNSKMSPWQLAAMLPSISDDLLHALHKDLQKERRSRDSHLSVSHEDAGGTH